jgi:hypothetical protein
LNPSPNARSFDHESGRGKTRNPDQVGPMSALVKEYPGGPTAHHIREMEIELREQLNALEKQ